MVFDRGDNGVLVATCAGVGVLFCVGDEVGAGASLCGGRPILMMVGSLIVGCDP